MDTLETVVEKIRELKRRHARELEAMYVFHADEYLQEMLDHRRCVDDSAYMNIDETFPDQVEFKDALAVWACLVSLVHVVSTERNRKSTNVPGRASTSSRHSKMICLRYGMVT